MRRPQRANATTQTRHAESKNPSAVSSGTPASGGPGPGWGRSRMALGGRWAHILMPSLKKRHNTEERTPALDRKPPRRGRHRCCSRASWVQRCGRPRCRHCRPQRPKQQRPFSSPRLWLVRRPSSPAPCASGAAPSGSPPPPSPWLLPLPGPGPARPGVSLAPGKNQQTGPRGLHPACGHLPTHVRPAVARNIAKRTAN